MIQLSVAPTNCPILDIVRTIHRLIVRERDREALLHAICRELIGHQQLRSVQLLPMQRDGTPEGHYFYANRSPDGAGNVICARIAPPSDVGSRDYCLLPVIGGQYHYATLPLRYHTDLHGWLTLQLSQPLTCAESETLAELADDIGHALHTLDSEEQLRHSEARYRVMFESARDAILILRGSRVTICNETALTTFGYQRYEDLLGTCAADRSPPQQPDGSDSASRSAALTAAAFAGQSQLFEWQYRRAEGELFMADVSLNAFTLNGVAYLQAIVRDISERKQAEQALQQSRTLYRTLIDSMQDGVFIVQDQQLVFCNEAIAHSGGYRPEAVLDRPFIDLVYPDDRPLVISYHLRRLQGEQVPNSYLLRMLHADGHPIPCRLTVAPISRHGAPAIMGTIKDLSAEVNAEEERSERLRAEAKAAARGQFLAAMSHEIRTPMNAILGYTQLLLRDTTLASHHRDHLHTINRSGDHLLALIDDVLQMARAESGQLQPRPDDIDLRALLLDIERMFRLRAAEQRLQLQLRLHSDVPHSIHSDPRLIRQVLVNLLGNAIKFTERGWIILRVLAGHREGHKQQLIFEVEDSGCGIEPEALKSIFLPFQQAQAGAAATVGTGLGLAVSRKFARQLGGDLSVTSTLGSGSCFRFSCQVGLTTLSGANPAVTSRVTYIAGPRRPRLLIADDYRDNLIPLAQLLESLGFQIETATSGRAAVASVERAAPDLLLLDWRMPDLDGIGVITQLRQQSVTAALPIVVISASVLPEQQAEVLAAGADAFLRKPFREAALLDTIAQLLDLDYHYQGDQAPTDERIPILNDLASAIDQLPVAIRQQLHDALMDGRIDQQDRILRQIATLQPTLFSPLRELLDNFAYDALLPLLTVANPPLTQESTR